MTGRATTASTNFRRGGLWGWRGKPWAVRFHYSGQQCQRPVVEGTVMEMTYEELLIQKIVSNGLIIENVFSHMSVSDLLSSSLVCTSWCDTARRILRRKKRCMARVKHLDDYHHIIQFYNVLSESKNVPYNGLSIQCETWFPGFPYPGKHPVSLEEFLQLVIDKIKYVKHLSIDFGLRPGPKSVCETEIIFKKFAPHIQWLSVRAPDGGSNLNFLNDSIFSMEHLHQLEFPCWASPSSLSDKLVVSAPNLRRLEARITPEWLNSTVLGRASAVREFRFIPSPLFLPRVLELPMCQPKLVKLHFTVVGEGQYHLENISNVRACGLVEVLCNLIMSSQQTLEVLSMNILDLIMLLRFEPPTLLKLRELLINFTVLGPNHNGHEVIGKINLEKYFPGVKRLEIVSEPPTTAKLFQGRSHSDTRDMLNSQIRGVNGRLCSDSVRTLIYTVKGPLLCHSLWLNQLVRTFPSVEHFCAKRVQNPEGVLKTLWASTWAKLERLTFADLKTTDVTETWDNALCGIPPANCAQFYFRNMEDLNNNCQAPKVGPSILNLKTLKLFTVEFNYINESCGSSSSQGQIRKGKYWLSTVSGELALSKIPGLTLRTLHVKRPSNGRHLRWFSTDHLTPYVNIVSEATKACMEEPDD